MSRSKAVGSVELGVALSLRRTPLALWVFNLISLFCPVNNSLNVIQDELRNN